MRIVAVLLLFVSGCASTGPRLFGAEPNKKPTETVLHPFEPERHYGLRVTKEQAEQIKRTDARSDEAIRRGEQIGVSQPYTLPGQCAKGG
jgi:hypothetical protein